MADTRLQEGHTPLHAAVISLQKTMVRALLAHGADVDAVDKVREEGGDTVNA